jgi:predicted metal-dependent HD superfamily phosphohydrolase
MLHRKWRDLLHAWAVDATAADAAFEDICRCYSEPGRFYHTLDHIENVLETVEALGSHARHLDAVKLAAWLHDVIYDSKVPDNEERSARYAECLCAAFAIAEGSRIADLIRKTRTHDAGEDADAQVLLDADLAILGESEADYRIYAEKIRREYDWVPEAEYRSARRRILESFLTRPRIYHWLIHREAPARRNIAVEIADLSVR